MKIEDVNKTGKVNVSNRQIFERDLQSNVDNLQTTHSDCYYKSPTELQRRRHLASVIAMQ